MSSIPSNLGRVPNLLASQIMLGSLTRTNQSLLNSQIQLASGKSLLRPSDDVVAAGTVSVLDDLMERREQRVRNLTHAESVLNNIDAALGESADMVMEARSIGLSQIGVGSDPATREMQASVIDSMVEQLVSIANRKHQDVHLFGGAASGTAPIVDLFGGFKYVGEGEGLFTDLGLARSMPITVSAERAFGTMSSRVQGAADLQPAMTGNTRLADLHGARGEGVARGVIDVNVGGTELTVDLSDAHNVQDVLDTLQAAIQQEDPGASVSIDPANGRAFVIEPSGGVDISISDQSTESTAADLGLDGTFSGGAATVGADVAPKLTPRTEVTSLAGVSAPLGTIRLTNAGQSRDLDLSEAETVEDILRMVQELDLGIRVEIDETNNRLNFTNELSGGVMSIGEVGGGDTATQLGVRSMAETTLLADFNQGRGVQIRSGSLDPVTGDPDPDADRDFRVSLKNGDTFDVDLAGAENVQDVLDIINQAAADAGVPPGDFSAHLASDGNGIALTDETDVTGETAVAALNGSHAAEDLGLLGTTDSATLTGEDRAGVAVESVIAHLISLRDALKADDEAGIELATGKLEQDLDRMTQTRAEVGARTQRIVDAKGREKDLQIQDQSLKSQLQDLDYTEAAIQFATLQQQLQAGLQTASYVNSMSLLDFLR